MTPISVLRIFLVGIWSWALLGCGLYFLWEWADGTDPLVVRATDNLATEQDPLLDQPRADVSRDDQGGWPYLATALGLLVLTAGGSLPVMRLFNKRAASDPTPERGGKIETVERPDGSKLRVEIYGRPEGPTLVFSHGWSLDSTAWHYAKKALSGDYRLIVWDLPGLGRSKGPKNNDYSLEKMADDLDAVIRVLGKGPVVLVGHSIGGMIIQTFCRLFPQQLSTVVSGIVLIHTTYTNPIRTALGATLWTMIEKPIIVPLNYLLIWLAPLAWISNWMSYRNGSLHMTSRFTSFAGNQTWGQLDYRARLAAKAWPAVIARGNLAMLNFDAESVLPNIDIPTLVVGGKHDRVTKPIASDRIDQLLPQGVKMLIPAGHMGFWEQHAETTALISEFAAKVTTTTAPVVTNKRAAVL